jgi:O-acetylserine/cysteine efflux transporter
MRTNHRTTLLALVASGLLWGTTVPLTKVALADWGPGWLTVARFALAALPLAWLGRHHLRRAVSAATLGWGVIGYGAVIVLQNAGIGRTSVSHAALLVGATPVLVALFTAGLGRARVGAVSWLGFAVALAGVGVIGAHGGGGSSLAGDALVLASLLLSAAFLVAQPRMLAGRDPVAVTAVQLAAAAVGTVPAALLIDGVPGTLPGLTPTLAMAGLAVGGTLLPFTLFAWAQARISPEIAGAFLNLEPLVGVVLGAVAFGDPVGAVQILGGLAILAGIALNAGALGTRRSAQRRATMASASRSAAPGAWAKNNEGSASSNSMRTGSPSGPGIMSTRAYRSRLAPPGTAARARAATDSSAVVGVRAEMSSS